MSIDHEIPIAERVAAFKARRANPPPWEPGKPQEPHHDPETIQRHLQREEAAKRERMGDIETAVQLWHLAGDDEHAASLVAACAEHPEIAEAHGRAVKARERHRTLQKAHEHMAAGRHHEAALAFDDAGYPEFALDPLAAIAAGPAADPLADVKAALAALRGR